MSPNSDAAQDKNVWLNAEWPPETEESIRSKMAALGISPDFLDGFSSPPDDDAMFEEMKKDYPLDTLPREPEMYNFGMGYNHDQACAVHHSGDDRRFAVHDSNDGVFHPSWKAQSEGWFLVSAKTPFKRWLLRTFFDIETKVLNAFIKN